MERFEKRSLGVVIGHWSWRTWEFEILDTVTLTVYKIPTFPGNVELNDRAMILEQPVTKSCSLARSDSDLH